MKNCAILTESRDEFLDTQQKLLDLGFVWLTGKKYLLLPWKEQELRKIFSNYTGVYGIGLKFTNERTNNIMFFISSKEQIDSVNIVNSLEDLIARYAQFVLV